MKTATSALLLAAACLLGRPAGAGAISGRETLSELLARERIDVQIPRSEDLGKPVTSGTEIDTADERIVATYATAGEVLDDHFYVFRRAKAQGAWSGAEVHWPEQSATECRGGSITRITVANGYIYLEGHITPSATCTMVLTETLQRQDTLNGWQVALFQDGRIVYQHSQPHFAPTHSAELSIYDPVRRRRRQIYPPKPAPPLRKSYVEKVRVAYERCCVDHPAANCGFAFAGHNHHCDPERFENSVGEVVVSDATDSLAFTAQFEDLAGKEEVIYVFRHLREETPENREVRAGDGQTGFRRPLASYLTTDSLNALFERTSETLQKQVPPP